MVVENLFLSVGAMKAGTTFLYSALNRHPNLFFTPEKELHYFAQTQPLSDRLQKAISPKFGVKVPKLRTGQVLSHNFRRLRLSMVMHNRYARLNDPEQVRNVVRWYADRYLCDPIDEVWFSRVYEGAGDRWCVDFSNYNAQLSDQGWAGVRRHCKNLRAMYVMREPIQRLWSHMKFEMIPAGKRDSLVSGDLDVVQRFLAGASSAHARYRDVVASLQRNLAPEELHVVRLEDVIADMPKGLQSITDFLGVEPPNDASIDPNKRSNETEALDIPAPVRALLEEVMAPEIEFYRSFAPVNRIGEVPKGANHEPVS